MKIKDAMLCMDCDEIGLEATHCMVCGSRVVTPLARWVPPKDTVRIANIMDEARGMEARMEAMLADVDEEAESIGVC
jgi:hypothetical protein